MMFVKAKFLLAFNLLNSITLLAFCEKLPPEEVVHEEEVHIIPTEPPVFKPGANCLLKVDPGPCDGKYTRWHYACSTGSCNEFNYGGCEGNGNLFFNKEDCEYSCWNSTCPAHVKPQKHLARDTANSLHVSGGGGLDIVEMAMIAGASGSRKDKNKDTVSSKSIKKSPSPPSHHSSPSSHPPSSSSHPPSSSSHHSPPPSHRSPPPTHHPSSPSHPPSSSSHPPSSSSHPPSKSPSKSPSRVRG